MSNQVLITGGSSGIGRACAYQFAEKGCNLILTGRRRENLEKIKIDLVANYNIRVELLDFDIRDAEKCREAISKILDLGIVPDLLINNAGGAKGLAPIHEGKTEHWEIMIDTNIKGLLYMSRLVSAEMVKRGSGHIINVCSTAGHETYPNGNVYCATKHAVDALTKSMRLDLFRYGLRVSQVSPAHVEETEFALNRFDGNKEKARIYEDFNPLKSSDVAAAIYFIFSQPPHVNIQDIVMMGTQQAGSNFIDRSGRKYD